MGRQKSKIPVTSGWDVRPFKATLPLTEFWLDSQCTRTAIPIPVQFAFFCTVNSGGLCQRFTELIGNEKAENFLAFSNMVICIGQKDFCNSTLMGFCMRVKVLSKKAFRKLSKPRIISLLNTKQNTAIYAWNNSFFSIQISLLVSRKPNRTSFPQSWTALLYNRMLFWWMKKPSWVSTMHFWFLCAVKAMISLAWDEKHGAQTNWMIISSLLLLFGRGHGHAQ